MKRFYYITFLAALAVVCLQASYIYHLYETYKEEKVAEMHRALKTAINDELVYNTWEGIDKGLIAEKLEELGWKVLVIWECELKNREALCEHIRQCLPNERKYSLAPHMGESRR